MVQSKAHIAACLMICTTSLATSYASVSHAAFIPGLASYRPLSLKRGDVASPQFCARTTKNKFMFPKSYASISMTITGSQNGGISLSTRSSSSERLLGSTRLFRAWTSVSQWIKHKSGERATGDNAGTPIASSTPSIPPTSPTHQQPPANAAPHCPPSPATPQPSLHPSVDLAAFQAAAAASTAPTVWIRAHSAKQSPPIPVHRDRRPLADYMRLPASQYAAIAGVDPLPAAALGGSGGGGGADGAAAFRVRLPAMHFAPGVSVEPVCVLRADVPAAGGCDLAVAVAEVRGPPRITALNGRFVCDFAMRIRHRRRTPGAAAAAPAARGGDAGGGGGGAESGAGGGGSGERTAGSAAAAAAAAAEVYEITGDCELCIGVQVPDWLDRSIARGTIMAAGDFIIKHTLNLVNARLMEVLAKDYTAWSRADSDLPAGAGPAAASGPRPGPAELSVL